MTFITFPHVVLLFSVAAFLSALVVWLLSRGWKNSKALLFLLLAGLIWTLGEGLDTGSSDLAAKFFFEKMKYFGIVVIPVAWTVYVFLQTGRERWVSRRNIAAMSIVPLLSLVLVETNEIHGLFFSQVTLNGSNPFFPLNETWAPGFLIFVGYTYALLLATSILAIQMLVRSRRLYSPQAIGLLPTAVLPWMVCLLFQFTHENMIFDPTPLTLSLAGAALTLVSPTRLRMGDILSVAHGSVFKSIGDAIIVLDDQNCIVDLNPAAQSLTGPNRRQIIGSSLERLFPNFPIHMANESRQLKQKGKSRWKRRRSIELLTWVYPL